MPRARRICPKPGCPQVADGRYCALHNREHERARGTTTQRGYGSTHQAERRRWAPTVNDGRAICPRCNEPIRPGQAWALDHTDDRTDYLGPAHVRCNNSAGGRNAHG